MKYMCGSCFPTYPYFFDPTLNIKIVFGEKIPKMGTFSVFVTLLNIITKFNNVSPKFCCFETGTTHIFRP